MQDSEASQEAELMRRIASGDEQAFIALYRRRRDDVFRFAYAIGGAASLAEDVTQDTFLGVLENVGQYDARRGSVRAWLLGAARHRVIDRLRRNLRETAEPPETGVECEAEDSLFAQQRLARLHAAIAQLPVEFRDAIVLCELMELSYVDCAAVMQCPVGTVRSRLHRARTMLAARLTAVRAELRGDASGGTVDCRTAVPLINSVR